METRKFFDGDYCTPVLYEVADRYGIEVDWYNDSNDLWSHGQAAEKKYTDFCWGPQGDCGLSMRSQVVVALDSEAEMVFHEIVHAILGKPGLRLCEGFVLMPFEHELAKWASRRMRADRSWFLKKVRDYQEVTDIQVRISLDHSAHTVSTLHEVDRKTAWWAHGIRRAQLLGLLDKNRAPTFKRPRWDRINLRRAAKWSTANDINWFKE